jgi:hypothetical protein
MRGNDGDAVAGYGCGVFVNGQWFLAKNPQGMIEWLKFTGKAKEP